MGVVHKLRQEVVDFIITLKKENPSHSCRGLVGLIQQRFQIEVSKSSVNAVIKGAQLSSSIGRKLGSGKKQNKFKIPIEKKQQLFSIDVKKIPSSPSEFPVSFPSPTPDIKEVTHLSAETVNEGIFLKAPASEQEIEKYVAKTDAPSKKAKQGAAITKGVKTQKEFFPTEKKDGKGFTAIEQIERYESPMPTALPDNNNSSVRMAEPLFDCMGSIFLRAAEWELGVSSIWGPLLSKFIPRINTDIHTLSSLLLYSRLFGIEEPDKIDNYPQSEICSLLGIKNGIDAHDFFIVLKEIENNASLRLGLTMERIQLFSEVNFLKLQLEDGREVFLDAQMHSIWNQDIPPQFCCPSNKIMSILMSKIIDNVQSVIIQKIPEDANSSHFSDFIQGFENFPGKRIKTIILYDSQKREFANFPYLLNKRRHFIIGLWPWQKEFAQLSQSLEEKSPITMMNEKFFYDVKELNLITQMGQPLSSLRVFCLYSTQSDSPFLAVATNILDDKNKPEKIISEYCSRWPNWQWEPELFIPRAISAEPSLNLEEELNLKSSQQYEQSNLKAIQQLLLNDLNTHCKKYFFPPYYADLGFDELNRRFYQIKGSLQQSQNQLKIKLIPPKSFPYHQDLMWAAKRLNESAIVSPEGLALTISVN